MFDFISFLAFPKLVSFRKMTPSIYFLKEYSAQTETDGNCRDAFLVLL